MKPMPHKLGLDICHMEGVQYHKQVTTLGTLAVTTVLQVASECACLWQGCIWRESCNHFAVIPKGKIFQLTGTHFWQASCTCSTQFLTWASRISAHPASFAVLDSEYSRGGAWSSSQGSVSFLSGTYSQLVHDILEDWQAWVDF